MWVQGTGDGAAGVHGDGHTSSSNTEELVRRALSAVPCSKSLPSPMVLSRSSDGVFSINASQSASGRNPEIRRGSGMGPAGVLQRGEKGWVGVERGDWPVPGTRGEAGL